MPTKDILRTGLAMQSLAIAGESIKLAKKKKKKSKDFLKTGTTTIVGTGLLVPQAQIIGEL